LRVNNLIKMNKFYEPAEDTFQLLKTIEKYFFISQFQSLISIYEVGIGSVYILFNLAKKHKEYNYFGSDINLDAIENTKKEFKKIRKEVNLQNKPFFEGFPKEQFDLIYFNTPYLPLEDGEKFEDLKIIDKAIYGGKVGCEVIEEFISKLYNSMKVDGVCYMLFSSLSRKDLIDYYLEKNSFEFENISTESHMFEELYVYKIQFSDVLKELKNKGFNDVKYFSRGKHSFILEGEYKNQIVLIKIAIDLHTEKEIYFLKKLENEKFLEHFIE